jgi:hypothetical protein
MRTSTRFRYQITILEHDIRRVNVGDETPANDRAPTGVAVVVSDLKRNFVSLQPENSTQEFSEIFAIYLKNYRDAAIIIGSERIDPTTAIAKTWELQLTPVENEEGHSQPVSLEVIEWRRQTKRALYLCKEQVFPCRRSRRGSMSVTFSSRLPQIAFCQHAASGQSP